MSFAKPWVPRSSLCLVTGILTRPLIQFTPLHTSNWEYTECNPAAGKPPRVLWFRGLPVEGEAPGNANTGPTPQLTLRTSDRVPASVSITSSPRRVRYLKKFGNKSSRTSVQQLREKQKAKDADKFCPPGLGDIWSTPGGAAASVRAKEAGNVIRCLIGRLHELTRLPT